MTNSFRISGNEASNKNIHGTVSEQLKKNFAKSRWKVCNAVNVTDFYCSWIKIYFQQAYYAATVIRQMQKMALSSNNSTSITDESSLIKISTGTGSCKNRIETEAITPDPTTCEHSTSSNTYWSYITWNSKKSHHKSSRNVAEV